jgi:hypothetical protein
MTNKELQDLLKQYPDDAEVLLNGIEEINRVFLDEDGDIIVTAN